LKGASLNFKKTRPVKTSFNIAVRTGFVTWLDKHCKNVKNKQADYRIR
jgi:hypothetical protein